MTATAASRIELRIPSRPEFICVARLAVAAAASRMGFDYDAIEDLKVATGEALTNAIEHAQAEHREGEQDIVVMCILGAQAMVIEVQDRGSGFDPQRREQMLARDELHEGGLGLLLIEALVDEVEFKTKPGVGTLVRMTKRLSAA